MQGIESGSNATALQNAAKAAATASPTANEIAGVAYRLWLERGRPHGSDQEDWFAAEAMLKNALIVKGEELPRRPSAPSFDARTRSEMRYEFVSEEWQEGHWEVWEREWGGARWVSDLGDSCVGLSNRAGRSGKAA
jgi:hypothetical protein